jgi:hypothetical protein
VVTSTPLTVPLSTFTLQQLDSPEAKKEEEEEGEVGGMFCCRAVSIDVLGVGET